LRVSVDTDEFDPLQAFIDHPVDCVASATADAYYFDSSK
jgi:hypothetical protein